MTKYFRVFAVAFLAIVTLVLLAAYVIKLTQPQDTTENIGAPDHVRMCLVHSGDYHILDPFIGTLVSPDDFSKWYLPLRAKWTSPQGECLINLSTFIEHFGITREQMQRLIDDTSIEFFYEYNLDILFSGDKALIEAHYDIKNEALHAQMRDERWDAYLSEELMRLQRIVNKNAEMSRYYHDIWTYVSFLPPHTKSLALNWMQGLTETGQYDRVNIVEFVHHVELLRWVFEWLATKHNMNIFTHYNFDVIYSGDRRLIADYYSIENEPDQTAQVQAAFERFVAKYGQPSKNPRLD